MTRPSSSPPKRLLILASKLGYQTRSFAEAARQLGAEVFFATDRCGELEDPWADGAVPVHFERPEQAAAAIVARLARVDGILALGDRPTTTAAHVARSLGLPSNSPESVLACRSKLRQREALRAAGLLVPEFLAFHLSDPLETLLPQVAFPCVVKPLVLAASQGVIRANNAEEFRAAVIRIRGLLESAEVQSTREPELGRLLVERYIPGQEVAVEGLLNRGELRVLALFDKPDPLEGPYFEETIYVTPSRLSAETQSSIFDCARQTVRALGLTHGPVHAEFRLNEAGVWPVEAQPRPIGGLCSRVLRFGPEKIYLENLLARHALGLEGSDQPRENEAAGVMMVPVPESGMLERVEGMEAAVATPGVDEIQITARLHDYVAAWPEGSSYLGFIFARGPAPEGVENALREAYGRLRFVFARRLAVRHPVTGRVPAGGD